MAPRPVAWKQDREPLSLSLGGDRRERERGAPEPAGVQGSAVRPTIDRKIKPYECFNGNYFIDRLTGRAHYFPPRPNGIGSLGRNKNVYRTCLWVFDRTVQPGYARVVLERNLDLVYGSFLRATPG